MLQWVECDDLLMCTRHQNDPKGTAIMTIVPLDPEHLTPAASINRLQIVDLPGLWLEEWVQGKTAYDLIGNPALVREILQVADILEIPPNTDPAQIPILFD